MGLPMKDWGLALRILRYEDDVENEPEEAPRRGRRWIWVIVVLGLAAIQVIFRIKSDDEDAL